MADEKENVHEGQISRRSRRQSSILKDSPSRVPLENVTSKQQRRSVKRVSFADTKTIKEFLALAGSATEWNSTYEATASCDSSNSIDMANIGEKSNSSSINALNVQPVVNSVPAAGLEKRETGESSADENLDTSGFLRDILEWDSSKCASGVTCSPCDEPDNVSPSNDSFLTSFLNMTSSDSAQDNIKKPVMVDNYGDKKVAAQSGRFFTASGDDSFYENKMDVLFHDEVAQKMIAELKMSCSGATCAKTGQISEKVGLNQGENADNKIVSHTRQTVMEDNLTQGICNDMEMTSAVSQCIGLHPFDANEMVNDMTDKGSADMDTTFPDNPVATLHKSKMTEMENQLCLNRENLTRRINTDMEMTCTAGQMSTVHKGDVKFSQDCTQRITADMEMTCPTLQSSRQHEKGMSQKTALNREDLTERVTTDMEITCPASQMATYSKCVITQKQNVDMKMSFNTVAVNQEEMTQKLTADMEMTYPAIQIANWHDRDRSQRMNKITLTKEDLTRKVTTDMEMTCSASQMNIQPKTVMNKKPDRGEVTCHTIVLNREDLTQKVTADMEMTCPVSQMNTQPKNVPHQKPSDDMEITCHTITVNREDLTQKVTADMEMTCPVSQMNTQPKNVPHQKPSDDMEITCHTITVNREDLTQKVTADMEMTCPASSIQPKTVRNKKPDRDEVTCHTIVLNREDLTQKVTADMEMTCPVSQMNTQPKNVTHQKPSDDTEVTCHTITVNREDLTQKVTADMEMTCPASSVHPKTVMNKKPDRDEVTCHTLVLNREDLTQKVTADMEMTCPVSQMNTQPKNVPHQKPSVDMEITCRTEMVNREDLTQKVTADMEMTCPASSIQPKTVMNKKPDRDEVTCHTIVLNREDLTQKVTADMEMTCPVSQMNTQPKNVTHQKPSDDTEITCHTITVNREDLTQKVTSDMEMTCPASQVNTQPKCVINQKPRADKEVTCHTIVLNQEDLTQKLNADMEMTCPVSQMNNQPKSVVNQKLSKDREITCRTVTVNQGDLTQKGIVDMEVTCPNIQMNIQPQVACPIKTVDQEDLTQKLNADLEFTCPAIQTGSLNSSGMTQKMSMITLNKIDQTDKVLGDLKVTCPNVQTCTLLKGNTTQKLNLSMEMTCPVIQLNEAIQPISGAGMTCSTSQNKEKPNMTGQEAHNRDISINMEMTSSSKVHEIRQSDWVQDKNAERVYLGNPEVTQLDEMYASSVKLDGSQVAEPTFDKDISSSVMSIGKTSSVWINEKITPKAGLIERAQENNLCVGSNSDPIKSTGEGKDTGENYGTNLAEVCESMHHSITESHTTVDEKARDYFKNNTTPASQILDLLSRNEVPRRKSLCFGLSNSVGFVSPVDNKKSMNPVAQEKEQMDVSRRKSAVDVSPSEVNKTSSLSSPMFQSFFGDSQDSNRDSDVLSEDKDVGQNVCKKNSHQVSPNSNNKRSRDIDNEDEHSSKRMSCDNSPRLHPKPVNTWNCQEGNNLSHSSPSIEGDVNPLSVSLPVEEEELFLHISTTNPLSQVSVEDRTALDAVVNTPDLNISSSAPSDDHLQSNILPAKNSLSFQGSPVSMGNIPDRKDKYNLDGASKLDAANSSQSEEGLEDIQMEFENSNDHSFSHSPLAKLECQSTSVLSANQSLFDMVAADALSSVKSLVTSFKKRMSDFHESRMSLKNLDIDGESSFVEIEQENSTPACLNSLQLSPSCNISRETNMSCSQHPSVDDGDEMISCRMVKDKAQNSHSLMVTENPEESSSVQAIMNISSNSIPDHSQPVILEPTDSNKDHRAIVDMNPEPVSQPSAEDAKKNNQTLLQEDQEGCMEGNLNFELVSKRSDECKFCHICHNSELLGDFFLPASSKDKKWIVTGVEERVRYFTLQHSNLELELNVSQTDNHWTVTTASWKPQASDIKDKIGQLVMQLLQCRIKAAILQLYGRTLCEIAEGFDKVVSAYKDIATLALELFLVKAAYLTEFSRDSLKVNLFSSFHHVNAYVTIDLRPPEPTPDKPYAILPSAKVTIGNLRSQTVEKAMADVVDGPKYIWRLVKAADMVVQGVM
ncbi:uncharacterized protein [Macrobrachium rosenbergii]|uniref:uncharacterized protein isoform X1 n=1 Tax=Macrobrachium rosenbergii TaxID=79674 RepID=UPI0034D52E95